ncbi:MAG: HAD-IC family P-type ATPase [Patescibacteria group bacterium]|nr:HAD-IC family P-type ATPase [Patescibacteria group bacterium]
MLFTDVTEKSFWALKASDALELLETTSEGITEDEAKERLEVFGKNKIAEAKKATKLAILLSQFSNPLIFLLLVAAAITLMLSDARDAAAILVAALVNAVLGFYQENKAEEALAHLKSYIEERIRIIRQSREFEVNTEDLVPGDIIRIAQGDRVPADARLIYLNDLMVDETILTGEALPVVKTLDPVGFHAPIGDQKSMIFSGTTVIQGFANAVVCRTGKDTEIGRIAELVKNRTDEQTPLQKAITDFSIKATLVLVVLTSLIFLIGIFSGYSILTMFLTSVAILVSAVPEGLPVAMTVILAIGVQRLAKKRAITRKLLAVETLGSTTVILTDKTGTLTEAKLDLSKISLFSPSPEEATTEDFVMELASLNCDVIVENPRDPADSWHIIGRPLERAVVQAAGKRGIIPDALKRQMKVLNYLPFNSANKFSATFFEYKNDHYIALFGAPEILLKLSTETPEAYRKEIAKQIDQMAYNGERVLGVAIRKVPANEQTDSLTHEFAKQKFSGFKFLASISFTDPIRQGVRDTIHRIEHVGIKTVIVTGDHRGTAEAVAKELGFAIKPENVINGADLDAMTTEELRAKLPDLRIVSRVSPEGKVKIVEAYQETGAIVAMTGDGINDAPSLKKADIGVAMGSGSDVAKDVAELVLLDDNYHTIVAAINEGRRTVENIRKVIVYLLSSVFDELFLIGGSLLFGFALPLNAIQILWVNFFTDSFPAIALGFEDGIDHLLRREGPRHAGILNRETRFLVFIIGIPTSALLFALYAFLLNAGFDPAIVRSFMFVSFGTYSLFLVFAVRSLHRSIFRYNPLSNRYLALGTGIGLVFTVAGVYVAPLQNLLHTTALPPVWLLGVLGVGIVNILSIEFGKWWVHRGTHLNNTF